MPKKATKGPHKAIQLFISSAAKAGLPRDSAERFLSAGYIPFPKQLLFHSACRSADRDSGPLNIAYGGTRGPGKTHAAFAQIAIDDSQRVEELKTLFLRRIGKYARESLDDLRLSVLRHVQHKVANGVLHYPNGSRIVVGAYQYEKDIDNFLSLEYDIILIEQAEQLQQKRIELIETVNRTSKDFRPRMYYTFNPGGVGHNYLKQRFIIPQRRGEESETRFIFAQATDNPALNKEYKDNLERLTGWQRKAWLEGDWDFQAGQFFESFREETHVIDPDDFPWDIDEKTKERKIPANAKIWGSLDFGFTHYTVFYLFAMLDGITYCLAEHAGRKMLTSEHAEAINALLERFGLNASDLIRIAAGPDTFAQKGDKLGLTVADQYAEEGIFLSRATPDRISGAAQVLKAFGDPSRNIEPTVKIFPDCVKLIECIPILEHDPKRPADVLKIDADEDGNGGDDAYDAFRYGLMEWQGPGAII